MLLSTPYLLYQQSVCYLCAWECRAGSKTKVVDSVTLGVQVVMTEALFDRVDAEFKHGAYPSAKIVCTPIFLLRWLLRLNDTKKGSS